MYNATLAAVILAGGKAQRLQGHNKAKLKLTNGKTILAQQLQQLKQLNIHNYALAIGQEIGEKSNHITDLRQNAGPLAGIEAALNYYQSQKISHLIVTPCDLPNISCAIWQQLLAELNQNSIAYAYTEQHQHPLCAVIRPSVSNKITNYLNQGKRKVLPLWHQLNAKAVKFDTEEPFLNINELADLKQLYGSTIWVVTGAGHNVGKTTVAQKLQQTLNSSIYVKFGHGPHQTNKPINYFNDIAQLMDFIIHEIGNYQHIIIESNKHKILNTADIGIFIDGNKQLTDPRPDTAKLKQLTNIHLIRGDLTEASAYMSPQTETDLDPAIKSRDDRKGTSRDDRKETSRDDRKGTSRNVINKLTQKWHTTLDKIAINEATKQKITYILQEQLKYVLLDNS